MNTLIEKDTLLPEVNDEGLTERESLFLEVLFGEAGGDIRRAMTLAGYSKKEPVSTIVKKLSKEITERAKYYMAAHSPQAVMAILSVLSDPNRPGNKDLLSAAKDVLDRAKVGTQEEVQEVKQKNIFILPEKSTIKIDDGKHLVIDHQ